MTEYDAIIIGAGQAGSPLAHRLADKGWDVALIERLHLGGSCINYGCTPTKAMLASAQVAQYARRSGEFGIHTGDVDVDFEAVMRRKNDIVNTWRQGQQEHADSRPNLRLYRGEASFEDSHVVSVNGDSLRSELIFINTGTSPRILPIEGIDQVPYLTNMSMMDLDELPDHLLVIGGSYTGLEFGQMFRRFGSQVSVVETMGQITPREDEDVAQALQAALEKEGIAFHLSFRATEVAQAAHGEIKLSLKQVEGDASLDLTGSHLLLAAGRRPNSRALNLDAAGVEHENGWIRVDDQLRTNVDGVYALGDITGGPAFTHVSYEDFQLVYHNLFHEDKKTRKDRIIPYAMFTDPELGRVGLTEKEARGNGYDVKVGEIPVSWVARATERSETEGLMKVVIDADTDQILGAAVLSTAGGELVQTLMTLMMVRAPWTAFHKAMFIHPTMTEGFFTLMDSVE